MDITGFNEQIGLIPKIKTSMFLNKQTVPVPTKILNNNFAKKANIKLNNILQEAKQTGRSVILKTPSSTKKFTPKGKSFIENIMPTNQSFKPTAQNLKPRNIKTTPFNLVPTANKNNPSNLPNLVEQNMPMVNNEVRAFENTLQSLPAAKQAEAIFNLPPTPQVVQNLSPVQRSFLKTDLPYKIISKNNFGQPRTKFLKNTPLKFDISIDQIQPAVDSGIADYYGK